MTLKTRIDNLYKRERILRQKKVKKKAIEKSLRVTFFEGYQCYHPEDDCPCNCDRHGSSNQSTFYMGRKKCVCNQYHKPPKKPCGCFSDADLKFFTDLYGHTIITKFEDRYDPDGSRLVPGHCTLGPGLFDMENKFKIFKRGKQVIKSSQGLEEILGSLP